MPRPRSEPTSASSELAKACTGLTLMKTLVLKASFTEHPHVGQRPMIQPQNRSRIWRLTNAGNRRANAALRAVENWLSVSFRYEENTSK
jgi:hypothetical protein